MSLNNIYVGMYGAFEFKEPANKVLYSDTRYEVVSTRSLHEMIRSGGKPYDLIYAPLGITQEDYEKDVEKDVRIAVLIKENTQNDIFVPASFISKAPDVTGVMYSDRMLAVNLGMLPESEKLDSLKEDIKDLILTKLGLNVELAEMITSESVVVSEVEHDVYMLKIKNAGRNSTSYKTKYNNLLIEYNNLKVLMDNVKKGIKINVNDIVA